MIRDTQELLARLVSVFRREKLDKDFDEEYATHIDLLTKQNEDRGLDRHEARRQAILQMGGLHGPKQLHQEVRGLPRFERVLDVFQNFARDLVHAVRSLAKARAFTFVCVVSLGIGMGTVIGIVLLLRSFGPPPDLDTERLVELVVRPQGKLREKLGGASIQSTWSYPDFADVRDADTGMAITGWTTGESTVVQLPKGGTAHASTMYVSANYFATVGVKLARGSGFDAAVDKDPSAPPVVILEHRFWTNRLGSDPDILGKTITLNRIPHVVVGISPERFYSHMSSEVAVANLWVPLLQHPRVHSDESVRFNRDMDWVRVHGQLSPGGSIEQANAAVSGIMSGLAERYRASNEFKAGSVEPYLAMGAARRGDFREIEAMFLGMAGMVLLVICLNVSGMMLVRSAIRERELSIRQAIGAGRGQLTRYLLCEALVLATLAGSLASALLLGVPPILFRWKMGVVPPMFKVDASMLVTCVGLCLVTSLMFGLMPAIRFSRPTVISSLKDEVGGGGRRVGRVHRLAAALQLGFAVPFLVAGGVFLDHVRTTATAELGFEPKGLIAAPIDLASAAESDERAAVLLRAARENLERTSGVVSVGLADGLPLDFRGRAMRVSRQDDTTPVFVRQTRVDEGYLRTMGIRLVRGRGFTAADRAGAELVALLAEHVALRVFPNSDAVGQRLTVNLQDRVTKVVTIVGVINDVVGSQMSNPRGEMLLPLAQHPAPRVFLLARSVDATASTALAPVLRNLLHDLKTEFDPTFASRHTQYASSIVRGETLVQNSMDDMYGQSTTAMIGGGVALTLAALGVYGVVGFMVAMRIREMAVRIALGATQLRVWRTILTDVVMLVAPGVAFGLIVAVAVVRMSFLSFYSLGGVEPLVYTVGVAIAICVALLASLPSARRAASVEPMMAIRSE